MMSSLLKLALVASCEQTIRDEISAAVKGLLSSITSASFSGIGEVASSVACCTAFTGAEDPQPICDIRYGTSVSTGAFGLLLARPHQTGAAVDESTNRIQKKLLSNQNVDFNFSLLLLV